MARIRSVHPGLLTDEAFMTLTVECPSAIALMLGLWIEADDSGTFEWKPITIKAKCLPAVSADVSELLDALKRVDMIREFEFDGKAYGVIRNFVKYQRPKDPKDIHPYSEASRLYAGFSSEGTRPNPTTGRKPFGTTSEPLPKSFGTTSENSAQMKDVGGRREDVGGREEPKDCDSSPVLSGALAPAAPRKAKRAKRRTQIPEDAQPAELDKLAAQNAGLGQAEFRTEWRRFRDHHRAKGSLMADWSAAWRTWLGNMAQFQPARAGPQKRGGVSDLWLELSEAENEQDQSEVDTGDDARISFHPVDSS
jgi:hypothetical protein